MQVSSKVSSFTESVIREMTRLAHRHGAVNLAQGFPDFAAPPGMKKLANITTPPRKKQWKLPMLIRGNAMSGAPICSGTT